MAGIIRVSKPTKTMLDSLKLVERESYDSVISRMLRSRFEEGPNLNQETKKLLARRMNSLKEGKVFSGEELLERIHKKRK